MNVKQLKALEMGPTQYFKNDAAKILPFHAGASVVSKSFCIYSLSRICLEFSMVASK